MKTPNRQTTLLLSTVLAMAVALPAQAAITLVETEDGWKVQMMGLVSVWSGSSDFDQADTAFGPRPAEDSTRVMTGFNPSKIEFMAFAPEYNGMEISTYFQIATSINGNKSRRTGEQIEVRAADISIGTDYGTFSLGRNFAIHDSLPIVNDSGSMRGIGYICTGPDGAGPNCGHIGTGYTWSDWTAGIRYASPRAAGLQLRAGLFDPVENAFGEPGGGAPFVLDGSAFSLFNVTGFGNAVETDTPLLEAEVNFAHNFKMGESASANLLAWVSGLYQGVEDKISSQDTTIEGYSGGGRLTFDTPGGVLGVTGNYTETEGIAEGFIGFGVRCNANVCDAVDGDQWYVNVDYNLGEFIPSEYGLFRGNRATIGISYGEGSEDANANIGNGNVDRELLMVYLQYQLTPNFNINIEYQDFERETDNTNLGLAAGIFPQNEEYDAIMLGGEFRF
ncbi:MAG: hypothetical protein RQ847_02720 [Wenzhouxiangellaceae bacterium]|nr:hypothetical protein [Wenzhouxiangellaceae bacterium]